MFKRILTITAAAAVLAPASALAKAPAVKYVGRTKEGSKISFTVKKGWIQNLQTMLPQACGSAQGGNPTGRPATFWPPFSFRLGANASATSHDPTQHWHVNTRRHGRTITGKLEMNWSLLGSDGWGGYRIIVCEMTGSFTARPKK